MSKTVAKKVEQTKAEETKKEFTMEQAGAFWRNRSKAGNTYFSGGFEQKPCKGFYVTNKKNPKEPDIRIYTVVDDSELSEEPIISLWCNVTKNGKKYLTGKIKKQRFVGFINEKATEENKQPYFSIYYQEDKKVEEKPKQVKMEEITDEELPF